MEVPLVWDERGKKQENVSVYTPSQVMIVVDHLGLVMTYPAPTVTDASQSFTAYSLRERSHLIITLIAINCPRQQRLENSGWFPRLDGDIWRACLQKKPRLIYNSIEMLYCFVPYWEVSLLTLQHISSHAFVCHWKRSFISLQYKPTKRIWVFTRS